MEGDQLEQWQALYRAIGQRDLAAIDHIIAQSPDLIHYEGTLGTCLHVACRYADLDVVKRLVKLGAAIDVDADVGGSPLDRAASYGKADIVKYLLDQGAKINYSSPDKNPLFGAIYDGHTQVVRVLLDAGVDPHVTYSQPGFPPKNALSFAQRHKQHEIVTLLQAAGCRLPTEGPEISAGQSTKQEVATTSPSDLTREEIVGWLARIYGPVEPLALQEIVPIHQDVHVAINVIRPSDDHPHLTLFTTGMSDLPMTAPPGQEDRRYAELIMHLPGDWPLDTGGKLDERWLWPLKWLRIMAYHPHLNGSWLGGPHTIITPTDPLVPLGPNTKQTCLLLVADFDQWSPLKLQDGRGIHFYTVFPLYTEERDYEKTHGIVPLLQRFQEHGFSTVVQVDRESVVPRA